MKRSKLITALAVTGLFLTGCGDSQEQATEPENSEEQEAQEAPTQEDGTEEHESPTDEYNATLDELGNPLDEDTRFSIGANACVYMLTDAMGTEEFLDEIERDNISLGHTYVSVELSREDVDEPHSNEVTRAAIEYICPEVKDKMTDDAWNHNVFREDQRKQLQESN